MAADADLRTKLLATTAITDIVGSDGVYVGDAAQVDKDAYIVIVEDSLVVNGFIDQTTGFETATFDFDCFANTQPTAKSLATQVKETLKDFSGVVGSTTFHAANYVDRGTDQVTSEDGTAVHYYVFTETLEFHLEE